MVRFLSLYMEINKMKKNRYSGFFCHNPFESVFIDFRGEVYLCNCPEFLPTTAGNLAKSSFKEVWNSKTARKIRESILDGTYSYCDDENCPYLKSGTLSKNEEVIDPSHLQIIAQRITDLSKLPKEIIAAYDLSCNLSCPACRESVLINKGDALTKSKRIHEVVTNEVLSKDTEKLVMAGNGEPLFSKLYRSILEEFDQNRFPKLQISLITNGLLLTPTTWKKISKSHKAIDTIGISVNAAKEATYKTNQRGGRFSQLLSNLNFIKTLRQNNKLRALYLNFYVQKNNYREMKEFIHICKEYGADMITFQVLLKAAHNRECKFFENAVHLKDHPEHNNFLKILESPVFLDPIVSLGNLSPFLPRISTIDKRNEQGKIAWKTYKTLLKLNPSQTNKILDNLKQLRNVFTNIMISKTTNNGCSPVEYMATYTVCNQEHDESKLGSLFKHYILNQKEADSRQPFLTFFQKHERKIKSAIFQILNNEQKKDFSKYALDSLLDIEIEYDPFTEALSKTIRTQSKIVKNRV